MQLVKNIFHFLWAIVASTYYFFPGRKMTVIGITGTDGKTTTANLLFHILKSAGLQVSLISSISAEINGKSLDTGFHVTTPGPWTLQKLMNQALKGGSKYLVLEVTSHALDQHRTFGSSIDIGIITNISHEHLDYHKSLDNYRRVKAKLLSCVKYSILNLDDASFKYLKSIASGKVITYSINSLADYTPVNTKIKTKLLGIYNLYNCLAAFTASKIVGVDDKTIINAINNFPGIEGRMEEIKSEKNFKIYIDFAHKINALKNALITVRNLTTKKLIVVFGCAGLRDHLKRPIMGNIAAELADYAILTAEDPRTEDVRDIIKQIANGCEVMKMVEADKNKLKNGQLLNGNKYFWRIPDRQEAINFAVRKLAKRGDVILLCGKGHEKSMCYGKTEYPWDEKLAVNKALYGTS